MGIPAQTADAAAGGGWSKRTALSMRAHLHVFSAALLLPLWCVLGFGAWTYVVQSQQDYERQTLLMARDLASDLEARLSGLGGLLTALATSTALEDGDFARFHRQAMHVVPPGSAIVVRDRTGMALVNTLWPVGTKLPAATSDVVRAADQCVFQTGGLCASDLYIGATDPQPYVLLDAPVLRDGAIVLVVNIGIQARMLGDMLQTSALPSGWTAGLIDRRGKIIARSRDHDRFVGRDAGPDLVRGTTGAEGSFLGTTQDGIPVRAAYIRLPEWGWRVVVGVPQSELRAPLRNSALLLGGAALLAAALSAFIALFYGRRLAKAVTALSGAAADGGNRQQASFQTGASSQTGAAFHTPVREVNEVAARLAEAASDLRRSLAERDFAQARLERLNQELEERVQTEVAARQDAQHRAAHAQRMQALGQLAGGMAHDFNNVLQVVTGSADSIEAKAERADTVRRFARLIQSAALRGKSVTHRLLAFARQGDLNAEPVEIAVLFAAIEELLTHTLGSHIGVRMIVSGDLHVSADRGQLETVLINLATNARDALPDGGTLMFLADPETVVAGSQHRAGVAPGTYVRLSVVDTGTGMDAATLAHSTDPFFTTKHPGQGTGLGLSMARGFAEQSGGGLWIESQPNQGTTVSIWLPTAPQRPAASELPRSVAGATPSEARPSVLLVEDEDAVREVIATQLADAGCAVVAVPNAQDALLALDGGLRVDALVTDLNMPGMNGLDLIRAVRARGLRSATILLTGNAGEIGAAADEFGSDGFVLLHKPVSGAALAERIADLAVQPIK